MIKITNKEDIPSHWNVLKVKKKTTVQIRRAIEVEKFSASWQDSELVSDPEQDVIVIQQNGKEYPCKKDIFFDSYEECETLGGPVKYIKKAVTEIVEIPEGEEVQIETLEGTLNSVSFPDYIAIGTKGELYANTEEFVKENLIIVL